MANNVADSIIDSFNEKIGDLKKSYDDAKASNRRLEAKIEQLETAKRYAGNARDQAVQISQMLKRAEPADNWKGTSRKRFDQARTGLLDQNAQAYVRHIGDLIGQIDRKLIELRLKVNYFVKIANAAEDGMKAAKREMSKKLSELA